MKITPLSICGWQEKFPHEEGVAVVFDIFRCSTTIQCLYNAKPKYLWISPSLKKIQENSVDKVKNFRIFSELSQAIECAERFDNSPALALKNSSPTIDNHLVATTTGTPAMFAAKVFEEVYVGSLVAFSALIEKLSQEKRPITLIPAAFPHSNHVEDGIVAQAVATALEGYSDHKSFVHGCAAQAKEKILVSGRAKFLSEKLATGKEDTEIALDIDRFTSIPQISFTDDPLFARVL